MNATNKQSRTRAPKGGCYIKGVFYKGGQFLPTDEPQGGKWNRKARNATKARKAQVAPYKWEIVPDGKRSLFQIMNGTIAIWNHDKGNFSEPNKDQVLNYFGYTRQQVEKMIEQYNSGIMWISE